MTESRGQGAGGRERNEDEKWRSRELERIGG